MLKSFFYLLKKAKSVYYLLKTKLFTLNTPPHRFVSVFLLTCFVFQKQEDGVFGQFSKQESVQRLWQIYPGNFFC